MAKDQTDRAENFTDGRGDTVPGGTKTTAEVLKAAKVAQTILTTYVKGLDENLKRYLAKERATRTKVEGTDGLLDTIESFSDGFEGDVLIPIIFQVRSMRPGPYPSVTAEELHESYDAHRRTALSQLRSIAVVWGVDYMVPAD